ncbi:MAG: hypothetical protein U1F26_12190 [Lysobacterales bacterium]
MVASARVSLTARRGLRRRLIPILCGRCLTLAAGLAWMPVQAAVFVVDSTTAGSACTSAPADCSLVGAMVLANAQAGLDTIEFNIPMTDPNCQAASGVCRITLPAFSAMPSVQQALVIDGYTQPGSQPNTLAAPGPNNAQLKIEITSSEEGVQSSSWFLANGSVLTLRGLALFPRGTIVGALGGASVTLQGNWFNLTAAGTPPTHGVTSSPIVLSNANQSVLVGGPAPADRNVIAGAGVDVGSPPLPGGGSMFLRANSASNSQGVLRLQGNLIGLAPDGVTALPLRDAVTIHVGDDGFQQPDIRILDNRLVRPLRNFGGGFGGGFVFQIPRVMTEPARVQGNVFGLAVDGSVPGIEGDIVEVTLGNSARVARLLLGGLAPGEGNLFVGGLRQGSTRQGSAVLLPSGAVTTFVEMVGNQHLGSDGLALDIPHTTSGGGSARGRSPIDPGDVDGGANAGQNPPEITSYSVAGNQLSLIYRVDSLPAQTAYPLRVDFYRALADEGAALIGSDSYTLAEAGSLKSVVLTLPAGMQLGAQDVVVGTATNANAQSSEASYSPLTLEILSAEPSSCVSSDSLFCSGLESPPLRSLNVRVRATSTVFQPSGTLRVSGRAISCTAQLAPTGTPLQSEGRCILAGAGAPGSVTVSAEYDTLSGPFGDPASGGNIIQNQVFVIPSG